MRPCWPARRFTWRNSDSIPQIHHNGQFRLELAVRACQKSACHSQVTKEPWESAPQNARIYENSVKTAAFWRTDCPNGYPYDPSRYSTCPYCGNGTFAPTLDPFTAAENSAGSHISGFQPTIDPFSDASGNVCCFDPAMPPQCPVVRTHEPDHVCGSPYTARSSRGGCHCKRILHKAPPLPSVSAVCAALLAADAVKIEILGWVFPLRFSL